MIGFKVTRMGSGHLLINDGFERMLVTLDEWRQINDAVVELLQDEEVKALDNLAEEGAY